MRRCIIHLGHPKTASTYLQHCLHLNEALLARHNIWLPSAFSRFGMYDLGPLAWLSKVISGNLAPLHVLLTDGPGDLIPAMEDYLFTPEGMAADSDILLSSELFFYYRHPTAQLIRTARRRGYQPILIAYLERQDRAAITSYLQYVRLHGFSQGVVDFLLHDRNIPYLHYARTLGVVLDLAGETPVILRSFDPDFLLDRDILTDFLAAIASPIPAAQFVRPQKPSNAGLLLEHYELLRVAAILNWTEVAERLRAAEIPLSSHDRARRHAFYYRPFVADFLATTHLEGNQIMLQRFMPNATPAERAYWSNFAEPAPAVALDADLLARLGDEAFNGA